MTATVTDLFCGAGGSSLGAEAAGLRLLMAANHWQTAIDVHQSHFPEARHDCADISQADPRRYPVTDILLASPECTNHSMARGISRQRQDPTLWDAPDPTAERSRATMWDVVRFAEQIAYKAIVVENVVEATKWVCFPAWWQAMEAIGYQGKILCHNSMHHQVPQSRDRIYIVWTQPGIRPDLEFEHVGHCTNCATTVVCRQAWKNGRTTGRYRAQWVWRCTTCRTAIEPRTRGAAEIIDWSINCPRIGDRTRPLSPKTRARIVAGLQKYGWATPITTAGAGNTHERTPGNRARPTTEPLPAQTTTLQTALAAPPAFAIQTAHSGRLHPLDEPHPTICASDDRLSLVVQLRGTETNQVANSARPTTDPFTTMTAGGIHHGLLIRNQTQRGGDLGHLSTPTSEPVMTLTTTSSQSLLIPYRSNSTAQPDTQPLPTVTTIDAFGVLTPDQLVDECGFRMLQPHEVAAGMGFPDGYIPTVGLTKRDRVKLAGNAVTPPVMEWICGRILQALEEAA